MNPRVTFGSCFIDFFFLSELTGAASTSKYTRYLGRFFDNDLPVSTDFIFVDFFWVNRGCERFRIHVSPFKVVSVMIFQPVQTPFSLTFSDSTGAPSVSQSTRPLWKFFSDDFPVSSDSIFIDFFSFNRAVSAFQSMRRLWKVFRWRIPVGTDSVFVDFFLVNRCW